MLPLLLPIPSLVGDCLPIVRTLELRRLLIATVGFTKFKSSFKSYCSFLLGVRIVAVKGFE